MQAPHQARKRFGQNFLVDKHSIQRIVDSIAIQPKDHIVEVGPGQGALTHYLIAAAQELDLIEIDRDLVTLLQEKYLKAYAGTVRIHEGDVLKFDFNSLQHPPFRIVGNLPYNISTPLLFHLFNYISQITDLHLMLQYEVAHRMVAQPGTKAYGRLSVMTQYYCKVVLLFNIYPQSFKPRPKVNSTFIRLIPHSSVSLHAQDKNLFAEIVRVAFGQRRKTITNVLKSYLTSEALQQLNLDPQTRPDQLNPEDYVRISNVAKNFHAQ